MSHYFFALALPSEIKQSLNKISEQIKENLTFKNWVHLEDYHITLAFLGHADDAQLQDAVELSLIALEGISAFPLEISSLGVFGPPKSPRILWAGTKHSAQLLDVQSYVFRACERADFKLDKRPFKPHITMARKWIGETPFNMEQETILRDMKFIASEIVLYKTNLNRTPKYEKVRTFNLLRQ